MKAISVLKSLLISALLQTPSIAGSGTPKAMRGYLFLGEYVITLPDHLRPGDVIAITDKGGETVFERKMGDRPIQIEPLQLPQGHYRVHVERGDHVLRTAPITLKARG